MKTGFKITIYIFLLISVYPLLANNNPIKSLNKIPGMEELTILLDSTDNIKLEMHQNTSFDFPSVDALLANEEETFIIEGDEMEDIYRKTEEYYGNPKVQEAKRMIDGLANTNIIQQLSGIESVKFPVGIKDSIKGYIYSIVFASAKLYPDYAEIKVYGGIQKPGETDLFFGAENIKFSYEGGIIGDATLGLFSDFPVKRDGKKLAFVLNGFQRSSSGNHSGTFITFDCSGFAEARVDGDILVSRDWILPTNSEGTVLPGSQRVAANLALTVTDFNDMVVEVDMPHFTLTRDTSISFLVDNAIVDFSDQKNGVSFIPPPQYNEETGEIAYVQQDLETENLWKGVYFNRLKVVLPDAFKQDGGRSLAFGAEALYIDSKGITGKFYGDNVLPIETGQLGNTGWAFSLDHVEISLIYSQIYGFGFNGRVGVPIGDESEALSYGALANLSTDTYNFNIGVDSTLTIPMWDVVSINLKQGSALNIDRENKEWKAQAVLCGYMNIDVKPSPEKENAELKIADIDFDKLLVNSYAPYVSLDSTGGHITFTAGPVLNNSILNIDYATLVRRDADRIMFAMGMEASVMSEGDGGAKTGGSFGMIGKPVMENGKQRWKFDEFELISLEIHLDFADAGYVAGGITFFNDDDVYGSGFYGYLDGGLMKQDGGYKITLVANARFGTKFSDTPDEYKYFSVDAYLSGIQIPIYNPIIMNGLGGGIYHHMRMANYNLDEMAEDGPTNPYSGIVYEPDENIALGIKVTIGIGLQESNAFNGVVTLELAFTHSLSLDNIFIYGTAEISGSDMGGMVDKIKDKMGGLTKVMDQALEASNLEAKLTNENTIKCAMMVTISLNQGFEMHGSFKAYLDAAQGIITGEGQVDLYASTITNKWHLYVGGYADNSITNLDGEVIPPVNVNLNFSTFEVGANLYLLVGNDMPGAPPIDQSVASFFDIPITTNNRADLNAGGRSAASGTAAAFGANIYLKFTYVKKPERKYINFDSQAGFDVALLHNVPSSRCSITPTSPHGQKGWRAEGKIYAYVMIDGKWGNTKIGKQYVGLLIQADIPNPEYFNAKVKLKLFNWLNINRDVELGEQCGQVLN